MKKLSILIGFMLLLSPVFAQVGIGTSSPTSYLHVLAPGAEYNSQIKVGPGISGVGLGVPGITIGSTSGNCGVIIGINSTNYATIDWFDAAQDYLRISTPNFICPVILQQNGGKVGIGVTSPNVRLDVSGDIATRQNGFTATSGLNNNINVGNYSFIRISGPGADFTITGITSGYDGKIVTLYNSTSVNMIIANQHASSDVTSRILTLTGSDISTSGSGTITLQYSAADNRWIVIAARD